MARAGQLIETPLTGERILFVQVAADTRGELLEMESTWTRPGHRAAEHVHPEMEERWEVVSGRAGFRIGGEERGAREGESVVAPAGVPHLAWNPTDGPVRLRIELRPALRWEEFVERWFEDPAKLPELMSEFRREIAPPPAA